MTCHDFEQIFCTFEELSMKGKGIAGVEAVDVDVDAEADDAVLMAGDML